MKKPEIRKKRWGISPAFFFLITISSGIASPAMPYELFGRVESQWVSEPEPIRTTLKDWGEGFDSGRRQWAVARAEAGVRMNGFEVSLFSRALADLRMNSEAVKLYGRIARKEELTPGQQVPVRLRVNGFSGNGFRLGYTHHTKDWQLSAGASLFRTRHLMSGQLNGRYTTVADNDYDFEADVDYVYYRDVIFDRPDVERASGTGWAFDLAGSWEPSRHWSLTFSAEDLFARIRWKDAPFTIARADTNNKSYDEDGYVVFAPTLSGREGYRDSFFQELDARYKASVSYHTDSPWSALLRGQYQFGYGFIGTGVGYRYASGSHIHILYWPETESLGIEFRHHRWSAALSADQLEWSRVRAVAFSLSYGY